MKNTFTRKRLTVVAIAAILTACGGGGGGSTTAEPSGTTPPPPVVTPPVVTPPVVTPPVVTPPVVTPPPVVAPPPVVPIAYTPGTLDAFNYTTEGLGFLVKLNQYRAQCGMPELKQNTRLDTTAPFVGIDEYNYYTIGVNSIQAKAAGYTIPDTVAGVRAGYYTNLNDTELVGRYTAMIALTNPTAAMTLMRPYTEIGIKSGRAGTGAIAGRLTNASLGNPVVQDDKKIVTTFPCANTVDIPPVAPATTSAGVGYVSTPIGSGFGTSNTSYGLLPLGTPIAVFAKPGQKLTLSTASVTGPTGGSVPVTIKDSVFVNATTEHGYMLPYEGLVVPSSGLMPDSVYKVVIDGAVNGVAFHQEFSFRTGFAIPVYTCQPTSTRAC